MIQQKLEETKKESHNFQMKFKDAQKELIKVRNEFHELTETIKESQVSFSKQLEALKQAQKKGIEKDKTIKTLKEKLKNAENQVKKVKIITPVDWNSLHLTKDVMNEIKSHLNEKMSENDQLKAAINIVSDHYLSKMTQLVSDSQEKTNKMRN